MQWDGLFRTTTNPEYGPTCFPVHCQSERVTVSASEDRDSIVVNYAVLWNRDNSVVRVRNLRIKKHAVFVHVPNVSFVQNLLGESPLGNLSPVR